MRLFRRSILVSGLLGLSILSASCSDIEPSARAEVRVESSTSTSTTTINRAAVKWYQTAQKNQVDAVLAAAWYAAAKRNAEAGSSENARRGLTPRSQSPVSVDAPASAPPDIAAVMACIRAHESGDYTIHNHGYSGSSGAYQYLRGTWLAWSARAGHSGYDAAFLAPPSVQDAVTAYALTNGGAGNWSMRWGNDPCTAGLPGGG